MGRDHILDTLGRAGHVDGDAARRQQVRGELGAHRVLGDRTEGREEDVLRGRLRRNLSNAAPYR